MKQIVKIRCGFTQYSIEKIYKDLEATELLQKVLKEHEEEVVKKIWGDIKCYQGYEVNEKTVNQIYEKYIFAFACQAFYDCFKVLERENLSLKDALKTTLKAPETFELAIGKKERYGDDDICSNLCPLSWAILKEK